MQFQELLNNTKQLTVNLQAREQCIDALLFQMQTMYDMVVALQPPPPKKHPYQYPLLHGHWTGGDGGGGQCQGSYALTADDLKRENNKLRQIADEQQHAMDLIMTSYRCKVSELQSKDELNKKIMNLHLEAVQPKEELPKESVDKMMEVMKKAIELDDEGMLKEEELISRLRRENRGLRQLVEISDMFGSLPMSSPSSSQ